MLEIYDSVKTYVIFVGHSRSGHSIVGSLLDAHPEVLVSHERGSDWGLWRNNTSDIPTWNTKKYSFYFKIHQTSLNQATFGLRAGDFLTKKDKGNYTYNYHVHGQWQGQYRDKLTVSLL